MRHPPTFRSSLLRAILSALLVTQPVTSLWADAPSGTVVNGEASFDYNGSHTTITASDRAIIEYLKFNIAKNESVQFNLPASTSRVLNRITGGDPSSILGQLRSNGIVYFVNPAGIYFGQHAVIDVGQLYAAAGSLSNSDFLARNDNFTRLSGQVFNEGAINASAIHLVGQNVRNTGALNSPAGLVMLAAGDDVLIGRRGEHVFVNATAATRQANPAAPGVENTGQINAQGGRALLAAGDLYALAIQNSGIIAAREVALAGQGSGEVWNRGQIDATAADSTGGKVTITGQYIGLSENSAIDASGARGGGEVLIGGDYQGANPEIRNATATYVAAGAQIRADATQSGSGGKVIVWADETTRFLGNISATGIASGGFAEVSGAQNLLYAGLADLRSASGKTGTLLLDPDDITISNGTHDVTYSSGSYFAPSSNGTFILNTGTLTAQLALSNVEVKTLDGDITVADAIYYTANTNNLLLNSGSDININASITLRGGLSLLAGSGLINVGAGGGVFAVGSFLADSGTMRGDGSSALNINTSGGAGTGRNGGNVTIAGIEAFAAATINADGGSGAIGDYGNLGGSGGKGGNISVTFTGVIGGNIDIHANGGKGGDGTTSTTNPTGGGAPGGAAVRNSSYKGGGGGAGGAAGNAGAKGGNGDNQHPGDNENVPGSDGGYGGTAGGNGGNGGAIDAKFAELARADGNIAIASNGGDGGNGGNGGNGIDNTAGGGGSGGAGGGGGGGGGHGGTGGNGGAISLIFPETTATYTGDIFLRSNGGHGGRGGNGGRGGDGGNATSIVSLDGDGGGGGGGGNGGNGGSGGNGGMIIIAGKATGGNSLTINNNRGTGDGAGNAGSGGNGGNPADDGTRGNSGAGGTAGSTGNSGISGTITLRTLQLATLGSQIYNSNVLLDGNVLLDAGASGTVSFAQNLTPVAATSAALTVSNAREVAFVGTLGGGFDSISLTGTLIKLGNNTNITTTGNQAYSGSLSFNGSNLAFQSGGNIDFNATVSNAGASLTLDADTVSIGQNLDISALTVTGNGGIAINATSLITQSSQSYNGPVTLGGDASFTSRSGGINFTKDITGPGSVSLSATSGNLSLAGITTAALDISGSNITITGALRTTNAADGDITLRATGTTRLVHAATTDALIDSAAKFTSTSAVFITENAANTITAAGDIAITTTTGNITLNGSVAATAGSIALQGKTHIIATIISAGDSVTLRADGNITTGNVTSPGSQSYTAASFTGTGLLNATNASTGNITINTNPGGRIEFTGAGGVATGGSFSATTGYFNLANTGAGIAANRDISIAAQSNHISINNAVTSTNGSIALRIDGIGEIHVYAPLTTLGSGSITLRSDANAFLNASGAIVSGGNLAIDSNAFTASAATSAITAAGDISITTHAGGITLNGALASTGGDITLVSGGALSSTALITALSGSLNATARDNLSLAGVTTAGAQTYTGSNLTVSGPLQTTGPAGDIVILAAGTTLLTGAGAINSAAKFTATSAVFVSENTASTITAGGDIAITTTTGNIAINGDTRSTAGSATFLSSGNIAVGGVTTGGSQSYTAASFTGTGLLKTTNASAGDIVIETTNAAGISGANGRIESARDIDISALSLSALAAANTLTANRDITINTGNDITLNGNLTAAAAGGAGAITLASTNGNISLLGVTATSNGDQTYTAAGNIILTDLLDAGSGNIIANAGGDLTLPTILANNSLSFSGSNITITGTLRTTDAAAGDITLRATGTTRLAHTAAANGLIDSAARFTSTSAVFTTENAANTITAGGDIAITATAATGDATLLDGALASLTGGITLSTSGGDLKANASITAASTLTVNTGAGGITIGNVTTGGLQTHTAASFTGTGLIKTTDAATGDIVIDTAGNILITGDEGRIDSAAGITAAARDGFTTAGAANTITAAGNIAIDVDQGHIALGGALASVNGSIALTSTSGNITATAPVASGTAGAGSVTMTASTGNITVGNVLTGGAQRYDATNFTGTGALVAKDAIAGDIIFHTRAGTSMISGGGRVEAGNSLQVLADSFITQNAANTIATGGSVLIETRDTITINGIVDAAKGNVGMFTEAGNITVNAVVYSGTAAGPGQALLQSGGALTMGDVVSGGTQEHRAAATITGTGLLKTLGAGADIIMDARGALSLEQGGQVESAAKFTAAAGSLTTAASANTIHAAGAVDIHATGQILLNANLVSDAGGITIGGSNAHLISNADIISGTAGTGGLIINTSTGLGNITVLNVITGGPQSYTGNRVQVNGTAKTLDATAGDIAINAISYAEVSGKIDSAGALLVTSPTFVSATADSVITAARSITIDSTAATGDAVTLNGALTSLNDAITITTAGGGITANAQLTAATLAASAANGAITLGNVATTSAQTYAAGSFTGTGLLETTAAATGDIRFDITRAATLTGPGGRIESARDITADAGSFQTVSTANTLAAARHITLATADDITLAGDITATAGNIALTTTGAGGITLFNATSSGSQTHATAGGNINVTGAVSVAASSALHFSTTAAAATGTTIVNAGAALVTPGIPLLVEGGLHLDAAGRITSPNGIDIRAAHAGVTLNAALVTATISITGAGHIAINGGIGTTGVQTYATDGGGIDITSLLRTTNAGSAITFNTYNALTGATGMTTVSAGGLETNNASITATGGLTLAENTTLRANAAGLDIDAQGRAAAIHIALGETGNTLPQITIRNAGDILLSGVTTTGSQYYHFNDTAAMRLDGALLATGNDSSITIENTRATHAPWATIFALGGDGIHIETLNGDIAISKYNTLLSYDTGAPSPTAGDVYIRAWNGLATISDISASHQVDIIARAITLTGNSYQSAGINLLGMNGAPITTNVFTVAENSVRIVTLKNHALYPPLPQIHAHAYYPAFADPGTGRLSPAFFETMDALGSIHGRIPLKSDFSSWLFLLTEAVQINLAADKYDKSLELSALEENMRKATAGYLASNDAANRITGATKESLYNVGIFARGITARERQSQHDYRGLFEQIIASETPSPEHRQVVDGRISETSAREAVALYNETFMTADEDGRPVSRASEILAALVATYHAYRVTTPAPGPAGFERYIDDNAPANPDAATSQKFVRSLRALFAAIDRIGLTRTEVAVAKSVLLRPLRTPAIPGATLRGLIEPHAILATTPLPAAPAITASY